MGGEVRTCVVSGKQFTVSDEDQEFYQRFGVGLPSRSPEERQRRRMAFRNDRHLYHRKCDKTGKQLLSLYPSYSEFAVYGAETFWGDEWDPLQYGREYDFSRPFFEQFAELQAEVPRLALNSIGNENCDYSSYVGWSRNCYLVFTADYNEDCFFGAYAYHNKNCSDFLFLFNSELCYECIDCKDCYNCQHSEELENCFDCYFCRDLIGCNDCFGCVGLRNKKYYFFNEPLGKEEYRVRLEALGLESRSTRERLRVEVDQFFTQFPRRDRLVKNSVEVVGDYVFASKNCFHCFDVRELEDCRYCSHLFNAKNCMDWDYYGDRVEMCYEMSSCANDLSYCMGCKQCWGGNSNLVYCDLCTASHYCFGSIGLKRARYCLLNKQYSKEEYEDLLSRITKHMKQTGEWGEFFPAEISPHCYDESVAQDYLPLSEEEIVKRGLRWRGSEKTTSYFGPETKVPDTIADTDSSITKHILACEKSGAKYKIIQQELSFYQKQGIPLPTCAPAQRYLNRMARRNHRVRRERTCDKCQSPIQTSYSPDRPEQVFCEDCYLRSIDMPL